MAEFQLSLGFKRYSISGNQYEAGKVYSVTVKEAEKLRSAKVNGVSSFSEIEIGDLEPDKPLTPLPKPAKKPGAKVGDIKKNMVEV